MPRGTASRLAGAVDGTARRRQRHSVWERRREIPQAGERVERVFAPLSRTLLSTGAPTHSLPFTAARQHGLTRLGGACASGIRSGASVLAAGVVAGVVPPRVVREIGERDRIDVPER